MIDLKNVSVIYDQEVNAIRNINLMIKENKCTFIIGENGSGKSTLLSTLVGLVENTGSIIIDNLELNKQNLKEIRNQVGLVIQNPDNQLFMATVYDDIAFGLINQGRNQDEIKLIIDDIADKLKISDLLKRSSSKLSGGQKRMVALATVLVMKPKVILMDEPSSFLDAKSRRNLIEIIKTLDETIIIASHDLDMAIDISDEIVLLNKGKVISIGDCKTILNNKILLEDNGLELPFRYQG